MVGGGGSGLLMQLCMGDVAALFVIYLTGVLVNQRDDVCTVCVESSVGIGSSRPVLHCPSCRFECIDV